ncbi:hypothetical protein [Streptomyces sp. NPDC091371]|uniref:hypothetical protein n=1 Tax=Streptomyces sp. NPDC091371 TaxID=3155303 RepID=UPI00343E7320
MRLLGNVLGGALQVVGIVVIINHFDSAWRWLALSFGVICLLGFYRGAQLALKGLMPGSSGGAAA